MSESLWCCIIASLFKTSTRYQEDMNTFTAKSHEIKRQWYLIDAQQQVLGRLASEVATRLKGKHKPIYTPHVDTGDYIVIINAEKIHVSGNKEDQKIYHWHTGHPGGIKSRDLKSMRNRSPESIIVNAVKGMMPKNKLGREMMSKLKVYAGGVHPHTAQQPEKLKI